MDADSLTDSDADSLALSEALADVDSLADSEADSLVDAE